MDDAERRAQIRRYWEITASDQEQDITHQIYHDDAVLESLNPPSASRAWPTSRSGEASIRLL